MNAQSSRPMTDRSFLPPTVPTESLGFGPAVDRSGPSSHTVVHGARVEQSPFRSPEGSDTIHSKKRNVRPVPMVVRNQLFKERWNQRLTEPFSEQFEAEIDGGFWGFCDSRHRCTTV